MIKRIFDLLFSLILLLLTFPLMLLVALLIKLESKGPSIFKQERVGQNGSTFTMYKFRSMVVDAASRGPHFTSPKDPRVTRIGRLLRKTSVDELPQIFNLIKGDMSLVGPRPNVPRQRFEYTKEEWEKRNKVRPGITGLAQAKLRSAAVAEERTRLDLEYVDKMSFFYDLWIILLTVRQIFFKGGY
jgi:lipopolysaccharide/colanic/teichoic acid biosynthesis glycosyltransferase